MLRVQSKRATLDSKTFFVNRKRHNAELAWPNGPISRNAPCSRKSLVEWVTRGEKRNQPLYHLTWRPYGHRQLRVVSIKHHESP